MRLTRYRFGEFELDPASRELWRAGERLSLPLKSLECLAYLVAHRERAVGRDELISAVWGRADVSDTVVAQTMRRARKALDDAGDRQTIIRTVSGFGYRWVAPVEVLEPVAPRAAEPAQEPATEAPAAAPPQEPAPSSEPAPADAPIATPTRRWLGATALLAVVAVVAAAVLWWRSASPVVGTKAIEDLVTVLPVRVAPSDPEYAWVRLGAMEYAAGRLRAGKLKVTPTEQTLHLNAAMTGAQDSADLGAPEDTALRETLVQSGAHWLLVPSAQQERGQWRVRLRAMTKGSDVHVEAQGDTPLRAMAVATDAWLQRIGRRPPALAAPSPIAERLQRVDAELDAGQLDAAREQITAAPAQQRDDPRMLVREGQLEYRAGRIEPARALFERALSSQSQRSVSTRAKGLMGLGAVDLRERHFGEAERQYSQALALLQDRSSEADEPGLLGNAYNGRGVARVSGGNLEGATADLGLARIAMQENGDLISAAMVGSNIGRVEAIRGHWPQAVAEFDRSIAVFQRYQVRDYLAATLSAKALAQLSMAQPAQALLTIGQVDGLRDSIEDPTLVEVLAATQARVLIVNGRLDAAEAVLRTFPVDSSQDSGGILPQLRMALALSRGDRARAATLATQARAATSSTDSETVLVAVQASGTRASAQSWCALLPATADGPEDERVKALLATALMERRFGTPESALAAVDEAATLASAEESPDYRIRIGVLRALLLLQANQPQAATAVLGELDTYADTDYRVAWLAWTVHRRSGNRAMTERAQHQADNLRGQRLLVHEPLL